MAPVFTKGGAAVNVNLVAVFHVDTAGALDHTPAGVGTGQLIVQCQGHSLAVSGF